MQFCPPSNDVISFPDARNGHCTREGPCLESAQNCSKNLDPYLPITERLLLLSSTSSHLQVHNILHACSLRVQELFQQPPLQILSCPSGASAQIHVLGKSPQSCHKSSTLVTAKGYSRVALHPGL
eukprot:c21956_g2_i2 orf=978-1352(-)